MPLIKTHELKSMTMLALPLMAALLAQKGMQVIDTIMLGWFGPVALAAGALAVTTFITVVVFCMGTLSVVGVFIMHARGADQHADDIKSILQQGFCLALLLAVPGMLLVWQVPAILLKVGQDAAIVANVRLILHSWVWGLPGYLLFLTMREFIAAFARTRIIMLITLCSIPLTFIFNYVFMYGKYGMPSLGIAGIGVAGAIVMWLMFLSALFYSRSQTLLKPYIQHINPLWINYRTLKSMIYLGVPSGVMLVLDMGMFSVAAIMIGYFDTADLGAFQITMQCAAIAFTFPAAWSMIIALQVGHAVGAKDISRAARYAYFGLGVSLLISLSIAMLVIFFPRIIVGLFLAASDANVEHVRQVSLSFIKVVALFLCFDALQIIANGILRGFKDTFIPMLLSVGCYWGLGLGSAYFLAFHTPLDAIGVWYGLTLGICSVAMVLLLRFFQQLRHQSRDCQAYVRRPGRMPGSMP